MTSLDTGSVTPIPATTKVALVASSPQTCSIQLESQQSVSQVSHIRNQPAERGRLKKGVDAWIMKFMNEWEHGWMGV